MPTGRETIALAAAIGVTLLIGGVEGARAATVGDSQTFSIFAPDVPVSDSSSLTFNKFDPALGTLTGVVFGLDELFNVTQTFADIFVPAGSTSLGRTRVSSSFEVKIQSPGLGTIIGPKTALATATCSSEVPSQPCQATGGDFEAFGGTFAVPDAAVADFVGPGTFDVQLAYSALLEDLLCPSGLQCEHTGHILWDGTLTVEYTYITEAVAVPEPGALALLGVGLAGLAATRRRKPD